MFFDDDDETMKRREKKEMFCCREKGDEYSYWRKRIKFSRGHLRGDSIPPRSFICNNKDFLTKTDEFEILF